MHSDWRNSISEWFAIYTLGVSICALAAKLVVALGPVIVPSLYRSCWWFLSS